MSKQIQVLLRMNDVRDYIRLNSLKVFSCMCFAMWFTVSLVERFTRSRVFGFHNFQKLSILLEFDDGQP